MNMLTSKIRMDLLTAPKELPVIHAVQGESNARAVQLSLFCSDSPWKIPEGTLLSVRYSRTGQGGGHYDTLPDGSCAYSYEENRVTIILAPQMMSAAGAVTAQVELIHGDQVLITFSFKLMVAVNPAVGIVEQEDYVNWKKWLEYELDAYIERVNQNGQMLGGTLAGPVNMNGHALLGLHMPTANDQAANMGYVNQQMKKAAPRNLLDNSDFERFVAQAGISKAHEIDVIYAGDRWILDTGTVSGTANINGNEGYKKITLNGTIHQKVADPVTVATAVIEMVSGTANITYSDGMVTITSNGGIIKNAALYPGEYTADNMPVYQPKGYRAELAECRRYFKRFGSASLQQYGYAMAATANAANAMISNVGEMITKYPTVTMSGNIALRNGAADTAITSVSIVSAQAGILHFVANATNLTVGEMYSVRIGGGAYLDVSADL